MWFYVVASLPVRADSVWDQAVRTPALAGNIACVLWARHLTLTVPLSTQYTWTPANLIRLGESLRWTS